MFSFFKKSSVPVLATTVNEIPLPEVKHFLEPYSLKLKKEYPLCSQHLLKLIKLSDQVREKTGSLPPSYHDNEMKLAKMIEGLLNLEPIAAKTRVLEWNQTAVEKMEENLIHTIRDLEMFELNHKQEVMDNFTRLVNHYEWQYGQTLEIPIEEKEFSNYLLNIEKETQADTVLHYFSALSHFANKEILGFNDFLSGADQISNDCVVLLSKTIEGLENNHHNHPSWREQMINQLRFQEQSLIAVLYNQEGGFLEEENKLNRMSELLGRLQRAWSSHPVTQQGENPQNMRIVREFQRKQNTLDRSLNLILASKNNLLTHYASIKELLNKLL